MGRMFFWIFIIGNALIVAVGFFLTYGKALPVSESEMAKAVDAITLNYQQTNVDPIQQVKQKYQRSVARVIRWSAWFSGTVLALFFVALYAVRRHSNGAVNQRVTTLLNQGRPRGDNSAVGQVYKIDPRDYQ